MKGLTVEYSDPYWVEKREMVLYQRPPCGDELVLGAVDAWKSSMELYLDDLQWLLKLKFHRFWSTVIYHEQCMDCLVSFLQEASPPYMPPHESDEVNDLYREIRRYVLIVYSRLITNKESQSKWMTKEHLASIIYDNFVFSIPVLWDICLIYGLDNREHISRILSSVFKLEPKYEKDAVTALAFVNEVFKYIILQVNNTYGAELGDEPPNLPETFKGFSEIRRPSDTPTPEKISIDVLRDLIIHLLDTAMTLRIFIELQPKCVNVFRKANFVNSLVQVYEFGLTHIHYKLHEIGDATTTAFTEMVGYIEQCRSELIDIFRELLAVYKNAIFAGEGSVAGHVNDYLSVMMDGLSERLFIRDYDACYPVHEDLEILREAFPAIDPVKTNFIIQAIYSNVEDSGQNAETFDTPEMDIENLDDDDEINDDDDDDVDDDDDYSTRNGHVDLGVAGPSNSQDYELPNKVKEESLISEVRDIFPHLGDGFILKCLEHYGMNSSTVINCLLEENLDEALSGVDRSLPIIPEDPLDAHFLQTGLQRLNVFDGDEFDIMTRDDVDVSRIHVGKRRSKYKDLGAMLDDKTEVRQMADVYNKYNLVCDDGMYSDEYDDAFDSDDVVPVADTTDDPDRPFVTPRVLQARVRQEVSEEESESEDEQPAGDRNRMNFCVNPEEMRARREANFQARRGRGGHRPPPPRNTDVTGKPKGQGQEKEVLANRDRKEKSKSARGNHSRRRGAQWKRSQGMVPS